MEENWICLSLIIDAADDEAIENFAPPYAFEQNIYAILYAYGVHTISVQDAETMDAGNIAANKKRLRAFFSADAVTLAHELKAIIEQEGRLFGLPIELELKAFSDSSWKESWKEWFKPAQVSDRIAIRAPWTEFEAKPSSHTIVIEPGMAFGTGLHETTQLCIRAIDTWTSVHEFASFYDVGCGSGVLAIAAAKCGIPKVVGIDNDPIAVEVSIENAEINEVDCDFFVQDPGEHSDSYDFVVANIISSVLIMLKSEIARSCKAGAILVLSGILAAEGDEVVEAYQDPDLKIEFVERHDLGEWCSLTFKSRKLAVI
ncbi:MAG: 50S ribosomal protein L11 methyltransferase [Bradymonadia bacterium]|jgi:ribosomal protein L11 methyltransferase